MKNSTLLEIIQKRYPENVDDVVALYRYLHAKMALCFYDDHQFYQVFENEIAYHSFLMTMCSEAESSGILFLHPDLIERVSNLIGRMRGKFQNDEIREEENELITFANKVKSLSPDQWLQLKHEFLVYETTLRLSPKDRLLHSRFVLKFFPEIGLLADEEVLTYTLMDFSNFTKFLQGEIVQNDSSYVGTLSYLIAFCENNQILPLEEDLKQVMTFLSSQNKFPYNVQAAKGLKRIKQYESLKQKDHS